MIRKNLKKFSSGAVEKAKDLIDRSKEIAVNVADQNDDGKLDFEDVKGIARSMGTAVGDGSLNLVNKVRQYNTDRNLKKLQPVFIDDIQTPDFELPKLIQIEERNKDYIRNEICQGSIGANNDSKGYRYLKVFKDSIDEFGLEFYPDNSCDFYYMDPSDNERYIALNEYFAFLKVERINELQRIARDLGARYFKVTLKEEQSSEDKAKAKKSASILKNSGEISSEKDEKKYSSVAIEAEMEFPPHSPIRPVLNYFRKDPAIQNLVEMRLDKNAPLISQKFMLKMSHSSGIKEAEAASIQTVIKGAKLGAKTSIESQASKESKKYLEYEIIF